MKMEQRARGGKPSKVALERGTIHISKKAFNKIDLLNFSNYFIS
jgi:hypothetical protein